MARKDFDTPHQTKGKPAKSRFGLRPAHTNNPQENAPGFSYSNPGKGVSGESSN